MKNGCGHGGMRHGYKERKGEGPCEPSGCGNEKTSVRMDGDMTVG